MPLKYKGSKAGVCKYCFTDPHCEYGFTVDLNNVMWTDFQEGFVCVAYQTHPKNEDGDLLIINESRLLMGLSYYAEAQHWRNRRGMKEQNSHRFYDDALRRASELIKAANGHIKLRNIDSDLAKQYTMNSHKKAPMLNAPSRFYNRTYLSQRS